MMSPDSLKKFTFRQLAEQMTILHDVAEHRRGEGDYRNAKLIEVRSLGRLKDEVRRRMERK